MILNNKHNWITSTYYLLLNRKQQIKDAQALKKKNEAGGRTTHSKSEHTHASNKKAELHAQLNQQAAFASPIKKQHADISK